jgi:hypothetical protein
MKEIKFEATIEVDEDYLNDVLEQYRNTKNGKLETKKALEHLLSDGLGDITVSFSGNMRKISHDVTIKDLAIFEITNNGRFTKIVELLATT